MPDASFASLDRRVHPVRPDLAAESYRGRVPADRFAPGVAMRVAADSVAVRPAPDPARSIDTEALHGEIVTVYEMRGDGWAWGQLETDDYVGYLPADALGPAGAQPTHRVAALRSYRYPEAELKCPPLGLLSMGARVRVTGQATTRGLAFALLEDGSAMVARHLVPLAHRAADWVGVAEAFLGTPYLWGGRTSLGLDCSALIQLAAAAGGLNIPRDTDMQEREAGEQLDITAGLPALARGDLVFWKGHVGIAQGGGTLLHANGHTMSVASEPLAPAVERIARNEWGTVTTVRRPAF
ncbi:NlpC/P60 family protein [Stappia sp. ES.058]|uniref:C40 family peptidase n=1 Tax=Stappia sp. ES.058 TaxID=1881061 RepID=UPI00087D6E1A|nr:NlpC/P60 family protein [Stappia sp. ES.058]SDT89026.1 NlpC/P60 family protein [Stappia sp. ES.058]